MQDKLKHFFNVLMDAAPEDTVIPPNQTAVSRLIFWMTPPMCIVPKIT